MKTFGRAITVCENSRGCLILDTVKGCLVASRRPRGCYDDCYAAKIAARYRIDFSAVVRRDFLGDDHFCAIAKQINRSAMPFVRVGEMGDPSCDWRHTISVIGRLRPWVDKQAVIITKHLGLVPDDLLAGLRGVCVNTSVSAMDSSRDIAIRLEQFNRLRPFCDSVLRVVTCDFDRQHKTGLAMWEKQDWLLSYGKVVETVFRPSPDNRLVTSGIISARRGVFLKSTGLQSVRLDGTFMGACNTCPDMCGINRGKDKRPRQGIIEFPQ